MDGVTLRDQFAMAALQGLLANKDAEQFVGTAPLTSTAYAYADAMLVARKIHCRLCGKPLSDSEAWRKVHNSCADAENAAANRPELRLVPPGGEG